MRRGFTGAFTKDRFGTNHRLKTEIASSTTAESVKSIPTFQRPDLLERAWALPVAQLYRPLLTQGITSLCGPTSVGNVLRSMQVASSKNPLGGFGFRAMGLDQIVSESAEVVPAGWRVDAVRPGTVNELRVELHAVNCADRRYIANFSRAPLFGAGGGHHSPVGGYLEDEDLAFILDVNAGYGPWLVSAERFFQALDTVADRARGTTRGLARFVREPREPI